MTKMTKVDDSNATIKPRVLAYLTSNATTKLRVLTYSTTTMPQKMPRVLTYFDLQGHNSVKLINIFEDSNATNKPRVLA